jgi:beta-glucosidase
VKELKGFKKVWIAACETKEVILELAAEELQVFSSQNKYELEKGYFEIEVGNPINYLKAILEIG